MKREKVDTLLRAEHVKAYKVALALGRELANMSSLRGDIRCLDTTTSVRDQPRTDDSRVSFPRCSKWSTFTADPLATRTLTLSINESSTPESPYGLELALHTHSERTTSMKASHAIILLILPIFLTACATMSHEGPVEIPPPSNHEHVRPTASDAGNWHVANFMNRRESRIGVQILDRYESPYYLGEEKLKAEVSRDGQITETVWLTGEGYEPQLLSSEGYSGQRSSATVYSVQLPWIRNAHKAQLTVWAPLPDGKTYELTFECAVATDTASHSGHQR